MKQSLFITAGVIIASFFVMSVTILLLQVAWLFMVFLAIGSLALYLHLRAEGYSWSRAYYKLRLFIYRRL